ncbi:MAG: hypothetical protein ACYSW3_00065 [Planctomycetota bacterium]
MNKQESLSDRIYDKRRLNKSEIEALVKIFGYRCRARTKRDLEIVLGFVPNIRNYGIYRRVILKPTITYHCGQSWNDEMRTVRNCILGRR